MAGGFNVTDYMQNDAEECFFYRINSMIKAKESVGDRADGLIDYSTLYRC